MSGVGHQAERCLLWAVLCLLVLTQCAALTSANQQHGAQEHCCLLCHVGPLPFLHTGILPVAAPVLAMAWLEPDRQFQAAPDPQAAALASRGPPA